MSSSIGASRKRGRGEDADNADNVISMSPLLEGMMVLLVYPEMIL